MSKIVKTKRTDRFNKAKYNRDEYSSFSFGKSLQSYSSDELKFTNYVRSKNNKNYCRLEEIVIRSLYIDYSFLEQDFEPMDEVHYTYQTADRLLSIINKGYKHKYGEGDLKKIYKMKHKEDEKFQIYLYVSRKNLTAILIDFFHLAIPSDKYTKNGTIKLNLDKLYNKQALNDWNINHILKDNSS